MDAYDTLADCYDAWELDQFSSKMIPYLENILKKVHFSGSRVLDLACGTGTVAIEFARLGYQVTGVDSSREMIRAARQKLQNTGLLVSFMNKDIRKIEKKERFDLATCFFDSINHLLDKSDLLIAFQNTAKALREKGLFIFDVNTIYGLYKVWGGSRSFVRETNGSYSVWQSSYDADSRLAAVKITLFRDVGENTYQKNIVEIAERGYSLREYRNMLNAAGLSVVKTYKYPTLEKPNRNTTRALFVCRKE